MTTWIIIGSLLLVIVLIVGLIIWKTRKKKIDFDYTTKHGIDVKLSQKTSFLKKELIEKWTESIIDFWTNAEGWDKKSILKALDNLEIFFFDKLYLERYGIKVNGINLIHGVTSSGKYAIEIATIPKKGLIEDRVYSLFRHEVSHVVVGYAGGVPLDNDIHHRLFAKDGLGA